MKEVIFRVDRRVYKNESQINENAKQSFLSHQARIDIIYDYQVHGKSIRQIANEMQRSFSSVRCIIHAYKAHGHTNRMRNFKQKVRLLSCNQRLSNEQQVNMKLVSSLQLSTQERADSLDTFGDSAHTLRKTEQNEDASKKSKDYIDVARPQPIDESNFNDLADSVEFIDYGFQDGNSNDAQTGLIGHRSSNLVQKLPILKLLEYSGTASMEHEDALDAMHDIMAESRILALP